MENVTKRFGKVVANNAINLELHEGEILSLLGENGSGKTTLMNMLSGIYFPDEGQIYIHGEPVTIASPKDAFEHGIGMIHQHFKLVDLFTATENIILGLEGKLDIAEASKKVKEICDKYGFDIDPNQKIYDMSVSQKQTVEIVKVLYRGADILILDEPTAVLTPQETDKLFAIMRNMKADGKSLIIITHKLHEVLDVSDRVAVLRKGEYIGDVATKDANQQSLTDMMVGHTVSLNINRPEPKNVTQRLVVDLVDAAPVVDGQQPRAGALHDEPVIAFAFLGAQLGPHDDLADTVQRHVERPFAAGGRTLAETEIQIVVLDGIEQNGHTAHRRVVQPHEPVDRDAAERQKQQGEGITPRRRQRSGSGRHGDQHDDVGYQTEEIATVFHKP